MLHRGIPRCTYRGHLCSNITCVCPAVSQDHYCSRAFCDSGCLVQHKFHGHCCTTHINTAQAASHAVVDLLVEGTKTMPSLTLTSVGDDGVSLGVPLAVTPRKAMLGATGWQCCKSQHDRVETICPAHVMTDGNARFRPRS